MPIHKFGKVNGIKIFIMQKATKEGRKDGSIPKGFVAVQSIGTGIIALVKPFQIKERTTIWQGDSL